MALFCWRSLAITGRDPTVEEEFVPRGVTTYVLLAAGPQGNCGNGGAFGDAGQQSSISLDKDSEMRYTVSK